jgi:hypothetical protein
MTGFSFEAYLTLGTDKNNQSVAWITVMDGKSKLFDLYNYSRGTHVLDCRHW